MKPSEFQTPPTKTSSKTPDFPGSAWSVSPAPPKRLPWMIQPTHSTTKRPSVSPPKSIRPKPRRNASVPQSVVMNEGPSSYTLPYPTEVNGRGLNNVPYSPRSPHGGASPINPFLDDPRRMRSSSSVYLITPQVKPIFTSSSRLPDRELVAPFEIQADPFRTPFDDGASVTPTPILRSARRSRGFSVNTLMNNKPPSTPVAI